MCIKTKDTTGEAKNANTGIVTKWNVSSKNEAPLATNLDNQGSTRIYYVKNEENKFGYLSLQKRGRAFVIDVVVNEAGVYDITANVVQHNAGGYVGIYVNDQYVGTLDCYAEVTNSTQTYPLKLLGVELQAGTNTIGIEPLGASHTTTQGYTYLQGFSFTIPESQSEIATITGMDASTDVTEMSVGSEAQISVKGILTNGGYYDFNHAGETLKYVSSNSEVVAVSSEGLITAVAPGEVTITVTAPSLGLSDTFTITVLETEVSEN